MNVTTCLKIARAYLLGLSVIWLLNGLFLVLSGDSHYLFNRPTLGNVIFFIAVHQYSTAKGWDKFFLWLLIILGGLLWAWFFTSFFPQGLPLTLLLMCFYRYSSYRWWVKGLLTVVFMLVVSLVLHLMNWSWEVSLTRSYLLVLCPLFLVLSGLTQIGLTKTDRT